MEIKEISVFKKSTCKSIARQILNYLHMIDQLQLWPRQRLVLNTKGSDCWVCCHFWQPLGHWISPSRKRSLRKMILHKSALDFRTNTMYCKMKISLGGYDFVWIRSFQSSGDFYAQAKRNKNFDAIVFFSLSALWKIVRNMFIVWSKHVLEIYNPLEAQWRIIQEKRLITCMIWYILLTRIGCQMQATVGKNAIDDYFAQCEQLSFTFTLSVRNNRSNGFDEELRKATLLS